MVYAWRYFTFRNTWKAKGMTTFRQQIFFRYRGRYRRSREIYEI